ncbi:MAG TPA: hypothetical protein VKB08_12050 [Bradyrhizobium sp.]|nr:hypothetical protein [Bradyrhizobium sp.]
MKSKSTATLALARLRIKIRAARTTDRDAERIRLQATEAIGIEPERVLKRSMTEVDGKPVSAVAPSD